MLFCEAHTRKRPYTEISEAVIVADMSFYLGIPPFPIALSHFRKKERVILCPGYFKESIQFSDFVSKQWGLRVIFGFFSEEINDVWLEISGKEFWLEYDQCYDSVFYVFLGGKPYQANQVGKKLQSYTKYQIKT